MNWQTLILLSTVFNAFGMITLRVLARDKRTTNANFAISAGAYIGIYTAILLLLPVLGRVQWHVFHDYWWRFIGGGLAFALTNAFVYKTLVYFDVAVANIAGTLNAVFAVAGSAIFLHEDLTPQQAVGALILLPAIAYGVIATHSTSKKSDRRSVKLGLFYTLLASICYGVAMVNEKSMLGHMSAASYAVFGVGGQFAMMWVTAAIWQPNQIRLLLRPRVAQWSLLTGALRGLGGICVILTEIKSNNMALAVVIANFRLIVVIFLGAWLLKEHKHVQQKLVAACGSIAGIAVMFWK